MRISRMGSLVLVLKCIFVVRAVRAHLAPTLPLDSRTHAGAETGVSDGGSTGLAPFVDTRRVLQASAMSLCSDVMFAGRMTLAAGGYHTCTLSAAGGAACWGDNTYGQTSVPFTFAFTGIALPCRPASLSISSLTPSAAPTPGFACSASLYRALPRMELVGSPMGSAQWLRSEESCRIACCATSSCQGFSWQADDPAARFLSTPSACYLFSNVTQLMPSNGYSSGVLLSVL